MDLLNLFLNVIFHRRGGLLKSAFFLRWGEEYDGE
jgi:hypothetical protein